MLLPGGEFFPDGVLSAEGPYFAVIVEFRDMSDDTQEVVGVIDDPVVIATVVFEGV